MAYQIFRQIAFISSELWAYETSINWIELANFHKMCLQKRHLYFIRTAVFLFVDL